MPTPVGATTRWNAVSAPAPIPSGATRPTICSSPTRRERAPACGPSAPCWLAAASTTSSPTSALAAAIQSRPSRACSTTAAHRVCRQPTFLKSHAFAVFDNRRPRNLRKGGLYRVDYSHYDDRDDHATRSIASMWMPSMRSVSFGAAHLRRTSSADALRRVDRPGDPVLPHADARRKRHPARLPRASSAGRTRSCCRANTGSRSGRASTARSSTTRARWPSAGPTSACGTSSMTMGSVFDSTRTTAS